MKTCTDGECKINKLNEKLCITSHGQLCISSKQDTLDKIGNLEKLHRN